MGTIEYYAEQMDNSNKLISEAEDKSFTICEVCGEFGKRRCRNGYLSIRCGEHS